MSLALAHPAPKFEVGARVAVRDDRAQGHCRSPKYLRGRTGEIAAIQGAFRDPERLAYHRPGLPAAVLYKVRFALADVFAADPSSPEPRAGDELEADIYEHWLTAVSD